MSTSFAHNVRVIRQQRQQVLVVSLLDKHLTNHPFALSLLAVIHYSLSMSNAMSIQRQINVSFLKTCT